ncbi:hypothetical protein NKH18_42565 [Streptomyces sp. M10(2022)]
MRALDLLAARHEALRTRLVPAEGSALQAVDPRRPASRDRRGSEGLPDSAERLAKAQRAVGSTPFRLGRRPWCAAVCSCSKRTTTSCC